MLGQLAEGAEADRVVPIAFHVDDFNDPWKDPFSDPRFSRRERLYSRLYDREHRLGNPDSLYLTPLLMVGGRAPMLGTDRVKARAAIKKALAERPEVALDVTIEADPSDPTRGIAVVSARGLAPGPSRREVLVAVATFEDPVTTAVRSGENAGKPYVNRYVARSLEVEPLRLGREAATIRVPVRRPPGAEADRAGVVAFVQDEATGRVSQAARTRWPGPAAEGRPPR